VARQTRAQRRARRARTNVDAAGEAALPGGPPAAPPRRPTARAGDRPEPPAKEQPSAPRHVPGEGAKNFIGESWGELKKVEWPSQNQVIQATAVVLIACAIVGVYLWGADLVFKRLVENVFLGH
jgi:preprotein translocase subunit SecE